MNFDARLSDALALLPEYLGSHVLVSLTALAIGLGISLPLAIASRRRPVLRGTLLTTASVVQTIPGLALLALFYPVLLALAALTQRLIGVGFSALGFLPAVLALALYSMLPVLRNTVTGLNGVKPEITEGAMALALKPLQTLLLVELPIALPVIMAGIRTAAVWVIGTATLSTPIGQTSLGNYIFTGLQTQNWVFVLFGCIAAAVLALAVDQLLALMQSGAERRQRARIAMGAIGLVVLVLAALAPGYARKQATYVIGAKTFTEQYVLAALIADRLQAAGLSSSRREGLGSSVLFNALASEEVDVYVDYTGTIWANQMHRSDVKPRAEVLAEVAAWLEKNHGIKVLGGLGFDNAYALVVRSNAIASIADLAQRAPQMTIAGDYEFFARPEWAAIQAAYGLNFKLQRQMQPEFMYPALADGQVDVIAGYSSDGQIAKYNLTALSDPKQAIPPYDAIVLVSPKRANDRALADALKPLIGAIDVANMRAANLRAAGGDASASSNEVARWLWTQIEKR